MHFRTWNVQYFKGTYPVSLKQNPRIKHVFATFINIVFALRFQVACLSSHVNRAGHRTATAKGRHHSTSKRFQQHHRRNSSTSVESQIIMSNYPKLNAFSGGGAGRSNGHRDKRMRRRSANAGLVDAGDLNSLITQFPELTRNFQGMATTSDDDNASRTSLKIQDSRLDVVVRKNGGGMVNEVSDDDEMAGRGNGGHRRHTQMSHEEMLNDVRSMYPGLTDMMAIRTATTAAEYSASNTLQRSQGEGRASKNSQKSGRCSGRKVAGRSSGSQKKKRKGTKSKGTSSARNQTTQVTALMADHRMVATSGLSSNSSFTSNSSAFALPIGAANGNGIQSSFSGMSAGKHSRSSKTSCDVGTQANAYEIATQTMSYGETNDGLLNAIATVKKSSARAILATGQSEVSDSDADEDDRYTEIHHLMGAAAMVSAPAPSSASAASMMMMMSGTKKREVVASNRRGEVMMSESEKLRMLLLPSK